MKNSNMVRTEHYVSRVVYFHLEEERNRFIEMYGDILHKVYGSQVQYSDELVDYRYRLGFTISKNVWEENILKFLNLVPIVIYGKKSKYWKFEG